MTELWLNFKNENGLLKRILVEGSRFTVGRTSDNDLCVPFPELSRRHLLIECSENDFFVSDAGSSNGTTLDDYELLEPAKLRNNQILNLGGGLEIKVEITSREENAANDFSSIPASNVSENQGNISTAAASAATASSVSSTADGGSIPFGFFLLAPLLVLFVLGIVGVIIFISRSGDSDSVRNDGEFVYASPTPIDEDDEPDFPANKDDSDNRTPTPTPSAGSNSSDNTTTSSNSVEATNTPQVSSDTGKIERGSVSFLSRIATNNSGDFLTGKQIAFVAPKINQFKNSGALAENLKNTKQNFSQIEALAKSKNLRPQFVAAAALAQLGNQRGDVLKTAQGMIEVLNNLRGTFGSELANDSLLMIAVYDQGVADKIISTRDMIAGLANKFSNKTPQEIRSIWFLRENGKLTDAQFDFVLRFIAIGIIMQNPKDFNVQSEAVTFN